MISLQNISKHGRDEIKIIAQVAKEFKQIKRIYLFGSCAKETDTEQSDVDTLIIWDRYNNDFGLNSFEFVKRVFDIKPFKWDRLFESSLKEFDNKDYGVYLHIKELDKVIYERED